MRRGVPAAREGGDSPGHRFAREDDVEKWLGACVVVGLVGVLALGAYVFAGGQPQPQNEPSTAQAQSGAAPTACAACPGFLDKDTDGVCDLASDCHAAGRARGNGLCHRGGGQALGCQRRGPCH